MTTLRNRREFLELTATGLMAGAAWNHAVAAPKGANDKLVVGLIGCGGRGVHDAGLFQKTSNAEVAYVSDVDDGRRAAAAKTFDIKSEKSVADLRRILDDKSVDAVIIATRSRSNTPATANRAASAC